MKWERPLVWLAAAHLALTAAAVPASAVELRGWYFNHILIVPLLSLVFCQATLLCVWCVFSGARVYQRLAAAVAGLGFLEWFCYLVPRSEFIGLPAAETALMAAILLVARWLGVRLAGGATRDAWSDPARAHAEGLRFSIRGLMLFTAAVALLSALARSIEGTAPRSIFATLTLASCSGAVGLVSVWAALGLGNPWTRAPVLAVMAPALGAFFAYSVNAHRPGWFYILSIMILHPSLLIASLLVARSLGYRLVRRPEDWKVDRSKAEPVDAVV